MIKILKNAVFMISFIFVAWFFLSWLDIVIDNCFPDPVHHSWNMFLLVKGW